MKTKILIPLAGLALFCSCGHGRYEPVNNSPSVDTVAANDTATASKLIKTATMDFKVRDVRRTADSIAKLTTAWGGMTMHQQISATPVSSHDFKVGKDSILRVTAYGTHAEVTVKVPVRKLQAFLSKIAAMSIYVRSQSLDISDQSLQYLSAQLKLRSRTELVRQQKAGKIIIKNPGDILNLKDDMIDQQISNRTIDDAVKNSVVSLTFSQNNTIGEEVVSNDEPENYTPPFFNRLGNAFADGVGLFQSLIIFIADCWLIILAVVAGGMAVRYFKKMVAAKV